jgi:acyl-CoA synthetase (AMP-forming)/AMP-acid ligase II
MAFNIADMIEHAVDLVPERIAVVCGDHRVTYAQLEQRANRLAHHLADHGVGRGEHVGIYAYNSVEFVETMFATFKLQAVPININYRYVSDELRFIFDNADLVALVHQRRFSPSVATVLPDAPLVRHVVVIDDGTDENDAANGAVDYEHALAAASPARDFGGRRGDDVYILYTGGTTGTPKGVIWRHEDVWRVLGGGIDFLTGERIEDEWQQATNGKDAALVTFPVAPLMHGAAQWGTLGALFNAGTVVLIPRFDAREVWRAVETERVNTLTITGDAMARPMLDALQAGDYDTSSLLALSSSAAIFSPSVKEQYLELLPNVVVTDAVGSTETGFNGVTLVAKGISATTTGLPTVPMGPDTIVIDDDGNPLEPGSERIGRMARSGNVPLGYYKDPEKTAETFVEFDGRRYAIPGDYARVEADGSMTLLGRGNQSINSGGEKIFPEEVEGALKSHPDVFDAIVVGLPDERWGQRVTAVVQPRAGKQPSLEQLDTHCRTRLAGYKVPRELHLIDEITRQPSGKPNYPWATEYALAARRRAETTRTHN